MSNLPPEQMTAHSGVGVGEQTLEPQRDRLWVNGERTTLVRLWASGVMEVATRPDPSYTWGPPQRLTEEKA